MKKIIIFFTSLLLLLSYTHCSIALAVTFIDSGQSLGSQYLNVEIDIGDIDNDGDYDLLLASQGSSGAIEVYINNGFGTFTKLNQQFPQAKASSGGTFEDITFGVILVDVNNDGWLDIVTADAWDGVNIYLNDKSGHFLPSQLGLGTEGIEVKGVDLGDIDNDGDLDMIFGGHQYYRGNEVWVNNGNGIFTDTGQRHYSEAIWHLAFGDIDSDGDLDYVFTSRYTEPNTTSEVYFNDGKGNFNNSNQDFLPIGNSFGIVLRDIDNDGDLDFIEPNNAESDPLTAPRIRIFLNNGSGIFSNSGQNLGGSSVKDVDLGDIDNDGDYDMVIANWLVENSLLINDGKGVFRQVGPDLLLPHGTHAVKLCDLDNDGDLDLVIGNLVDKTYRVYFSNQAGVVANSIPAPPTSLQSEYSKGQVILTWNNGVDAETPQNTLTYNLRVGTVSNPHSIVTGVIRCGPGNMGHAFKKILNNLPEGEYIWSVQTVDAGYSKSNWAIEQKFTIGTLPPVYHSPVYRFWSDTYRGHFFTISAEEKDYIIANYPPHIWKYEGIAYYAYTTATSGASPVYRFWSDTYFGHFFTISSAEKDYIIATYPSNIWRYEGIAWYAFTTPISGTSPVYRFWSDTYKHHFFTISADEKDYIIATYPPDIWRYEGIAWYAYP